MSRGLSAARDSTRLTMVGLARTIGLHPKTIRRWETGRSSPREQDWAKLIAFYAAHAPEVAAALGTAVGREVPAGPHRGDDGPLALQVVANAADALDVAPKRVREMLRAVVAAAAAGGIGLDRVASALPSD